MDLPLLRRHLKAIAGGSRLDILSYLKKNQSATVTEVAEHVGRSIKTVSNHLVFLENLDIVKKRRRGRQVAYRLALSQEKSVKQVLALL